MSDKASASATMESFRDTKTSINKDATRNEELNNSQSATFITGGAGMQNEPPSESDQGRDSKVEDKTPPRTTQDVDKAIPEADKEEGSDDDTKERHKFDPEPVQVPRESTEKSVGRKSKEASPGLRKT